MAERDSYPLLSVEEAQARVLAHFRPLSAVETPILDALGMVLAEEVRADSDLPPAANSAMDGYALRHQDTCDCDAFLRVVGSLAAGEAPDRAVGPGEAIRIMTGAAVPAGADTVVRFEDASLEDGTLRLWRRPRFGENVRQAGEDVRRGDVILSQGAVIRPQEIGMLAALGYATIAVHRRPLVALMATGDELLSIEGRPEPGRIRDANSYSNAAQVVAAGGRPLRLGIARDRRAELAARLREAIAAGADLIVTSGGVSVGDFDLVKDVLSAEGCMDFWWVNMKPGKPLAFGLIGETPLLALPGNPVAAMISFELFGRPAVRKMLGHTRWRRATVTAHLAAPPRRRDGRRHYLRVRLSPTASGWEAVLTGEQGSGILKSMVDADGLAVIPEDWRPQEGGADVEVLLWDVAPLVVQETA